MPDHLFNSPEEFHYDNNGHYPYIVFNGDEQTLISLQQALQLEGLDYYSHAKSFRPADDGRQYDWYIRLHGRGEEKPAARVVNEFLHRYLRPVQPAQQLETLEHFEKSVDTLMHRFSDLIHDFSDLKSEVQASTAAQVELKDVVEQGTANQFALSDAQQKFEEKSQELEAERLTVSELEQKCNDLETELNSRSPTAADTYRDENIRLDKALRDTKTDHKVELKSKNKEIRELKDELGDYKQWYSDKCQECAGLNEKLNELHGGNTELKADRQLNFNLESALKIVWPEVHLIEDSWDHLKFGDLNHEPVLRRIRSIVRDQQVPGSKAVQGANNWMELHIDQRHWRLYYCRKSSLVGNKIVAMIGKKSEQNQDMQWLRTNPPETCL